MTQYIMKVTSSDTIEVPIIDSVLRNDGPIHLILQDVMDLSLTLNKLLSFMASSRGLTASKSFRKAKSDE